MAATSTQNSGAGRVRTAKARSASDKWRAEIVQLAAEQFDRCGYHQTNVAQVALAAGIQKPSLYHYFASKEEVLYGIQSEAIQVLISRHQTRAATLSADAMLLEIINS